MYIMLLSLYENALRKMYVQVVGAWSQMVIQCSSKPMVNYGSFFIARLRKILTQLHQMLTADP